MYRSKSLKYCSDPIVHLSVKEKRPSTSFNSIHFCSTEKHVVEEDKGFMALNARTFCELWANAGCGEGASPTRAMEEH